MTSVSQHPFRFGVFAHNSSPHFDDLISLARKAESLGYSTLVLPDHLGDQFAPTVAMAAMAAVTSTLRIGSFVFCNDFRHPLMLAKEVATLDVISRGRFEVGLGAGWLTSEYEQAGIPFDQPGIRIERMEESLRILKGVWSGEMFSFAGKHYTIADMRGLPHPVQRPHPPVLMGGTGKRMLSVSARHADIVGLAPRERKDKIGEHMNDGIDITDTTAEALAQKVAWVRQAAGDRFTQLEINIQCMVIAITPTRTQIAGQLAQHFGTSSEHILSTPCFLVGTLDEISQDLAAYRERFGISYFVILEEYMEEFAPVVGRMSGR